VNPGGRAGTTRVAVSEVLVALLVARMAVGGEWSSLMEVLSNASTGTESFCSNAIQKKKKKKKKLNIRVAWQKERDPPYIFEEQRHDATGPRLLLLLLLLNRHWAASATAAAAADAGWI